MKHRMNSVLLVTHMSPNDIRSYKIWSIQQVLPKDK